MTTKIPVELSSTPGIVDGSNATAITINSSENVGIGTSSPANKLAVNGAISIEAAAAAGISEGLLIDYSTSLARFLTYDSSTGSDIAFYTQPSGGSTTERMRIDSSGNVGIGISPSKKLTVFGTGSGEATVQIEGEGGADPYINFLANNTQHWSLGIDDSDSDKFKLSKHSALGTNDYFNVDTSGNVGIGVTNPAYALSIKSGAHQLDIDTSATGVTLESIDRAATSEQSDLFFYARHGVTAFHNAGYTETMRIDTSGNVGIGTASPAGTLHVQMTHTSTDVTAANSNETLVLGNAGSGDGVYNAIKFAGNQQDMYIMSFNDNTQADRRMGFFLGSVAGDAVADERLSITGNGNVGIGNTSPDRSLDILDFQTNGTGVGLEIGDVGIRSSKNTANFQYHVRFYNTNGQVGYISTTTASTAYITSSDYRLKENFDYDWDATSRLKQLKPVRFNWISDDSNTTMDGFLAHEVSSIVPEAVSGEKDATYTAEECENNEYVEGDPKYQGIDHSKLVPLLVKTIQELEARITTLEGE